VVRAIAATVGIPAAALVAQEEAAVVPEEVVVEAVGDDLSGRPTDI